MKIYLNGDIAGLKEGIEQLRGELSFSMSEDGMPIRVYRTERDIEVTLKDGLGSIGYNKKIHFFRALGLFLETARENHGFKIVEEPQFETDGVMIDASRNAVMKVDSIKKMLRIMAVMGLNLFMLYTEDTYTVEKYPYFGYMRGRYTYDELKECDDYADIFGIEIVPCIQALAHLTQALKWSYAHDIKDTEDILLAGNEKTYEFIESMIRAASEPFRSRRIHIGMDEAHNLGLGKYLAENGYRRRFDIMNEHLQKVVEITNKLGLKPMIWSDMYFRLGSKTGNYYDLNGVIPDYAVNGIPNEIQLVYWDYYHKDKEIYTEFLKRHKKFGKAPVFAGGIWTWIGFCVNYKLTFNNTIAALKACKEEGVSEVLATMWGDNGSETNIFAALLGLQLYAEHGYSKEVDVEKLKRRFKFCTGGEYQAFMDLTECDNLRRLLESENTEWDGMENPSKFLLWQDVLLGLFDMDVKEYDVYNHYSFMEKKMEKYEESLKDWSFIYKQQKMLCSVLKLKGDIGIRIKKYYDSNDKAALKEIAETELPEIYKKVDELRNAHMEQWFKVYKPFGWEVLDIRYGGVLSRINTAKARITDYIEGKIPAIEELEEEKLHFDNDIERIPLCNTYTRISTASPI
jgi:N-acetyl-beta-hexosaminidase